MTTCADAPEIARCQADGRLSSTGSTRVWFSHADAPPAAPFFCQVCWAYGAIIVRHRPAQARITDGGTDPVPLQRGAVVRSRDVRAPGHRAADAA
jgi:hypothetical protein